MGLLKDPLWFFLLAGAAIFVVAEWFAEEEIPYLVPVAGSLPLTPQELEAVFPLEVQEPFRVVEFSGQVR